MKNAATILDQALLQLPDEQLADAVRQCGDDDLADVVRNNPEVRRFVLLVLLDQIREVGTGKAKAKKPRPAEPKPTASTPPATSSGDEKTLARVVSIVDASGENGTRTGEVKDQLGTSDYATRMMLQQLAAAGRIRVEGEGRGTRYYPTA